MGEVAAAYTALADRYLELFGDLSSVHPGDVALIERHLTVVDGTVLDVGCGPGHLTAQLARLGVEAVGLDVTPAFVRHARTMHPHARFVLGSLRQLPVLDGTAAGLLAWYSLIHIEPEAMDDALSELGRVAAPGAPLVIGCFTGHEVEAFDHAVTTAYRWPCDELSARLARAGFTEVERAERPADAATGTRAHAALVARRALRE